MRNDQFHQLMEKLEEIRCGIIDVETAAESGEKALTKIKRGYPCAQCKGTKKVKAWLPNETNPKLLPCALCVPRGEGAAVENSG